MTVIVIITKRFVCSFGCTEMSAVVCVQANSNLLVHHYSAVTEQILVQIDFLNKALQVFIIIAKVKQN